MQEDGLHGLTGAKMDWDTVKMKTVSKGMANAFAYALLAAFVAHASDIDLEAGGGIVRYQTSETGATVCKAIDVSGCVVIPESVEGLPVTDVGSSAFADCERLEEIVLPSSVTNIGKSAFSDCIALTNVVFSQSLVEIGQDAFWNCRSIHAVSFPHSLRKLGFGAFCGCNTLRTIRVPGGVTFDSEYALVSSAMKHYKSNELASPAGSFQDCNALEEVSLEEGVRVIGESAFRRCRNLRLVNLPGSLEEIRSGAFSECPSLMSIELPSGLKVLGLGYNLRFAYSSSSDPSFPISISFRKSDLLEDPSDVDRGVFFRCMGLTRIQIPATVTDVGDYAFAGCSNLKVVSFLGSEPCTKGWGILRGTAQDLVVAVDSTALGWYDPVTLCELTSWQGRAVSHGGRPITMVKPGPETVEASLYGIISMLESIGGTLSHEEKASYARWGRDLVWSCPECLPHYSNFLSRLGYVMSSDEKADMTSWAASVAATPATTPTQPSSGGTSATEVIEAKLTVTNVVMHYVQEVDALPAVDPLPADGLVAVVSEVMGTETIPIPCSWTNRYPQFVAQYGSDFVAALTKQTGKRGLNGTPLLVWQDFVAGTDPTDPSSKFTATIDFVEGRPVISWSPKVEDVNMPRIYRIFGKRRLNDADWDELDEGGLDGYNFFKVTVELASGTGIK